MQTHDEIVSINRADFDDNNDPKLTSTNLLTHFTSVDFPDPDVPTMQRRPDGKSIVTFRKAVFVWILPNIDFVE